MTVRDRQRLRLLCFARLTQFNTANLAADGLGQFGDKFHDARIFVGRSGLFHVSLQFFDELLAGFVSLGEDDGRLDKQSALDCRIGNACDGTF